MEVYRYRTGVVPTEQAFILELDTFLTSYIGGWSRIDTIADTASDRDYVWASSGEDYRDTEIPGADPIVIRVRGTGDWLHQYTYGTYPSFAGKTFEIYNSSYTYIYSGSDAFRYWMFGNKNFVCFIIEDTAGQPLVGYMGLIDSFYLPEKDPLPIANRGAPNYSYHLYGDYTRCAMHGVSTSGIHYYEGFDWYYYHLTNDIGNRSGSLIMLPYLLRCDNSAAAPDYEVRGSLYGVYSVNGTRVGNPSVITTVSGVFMSFKLYSGDGYSHVFGPVASGVESFPGLYINGTTGYSP